MKKTPSDKIIKHPCIRPLAYDGFTVQALAIRAGRIVGVGTYRDLRDMVGPDTEIIEPDGEIIQPAFHDGHIHLNFLRSEHHLDLSEVQNAEQLQDKLAERSPKKNPSESWLIGAQIAPGIAENIFRDVPNLLRKACGTRPVLIRTRDGHGGWLSIEGAQWLQSHAQRPLTTLDIPAKGIVHITEGDYYEALEQIPGALNRSSLEGLEGRVASVISAGVSCFHEAMIDEIDVPLWESFFERYPVERTGRMHGMLHAKAGDWDWIRKRKPVFAQYEGRLSLGCIKVFLDGSLGSGTAWMHGDRPSHVIKEDEFLELARFAASENFQLAVHAIGHRAVQTALDVFEAVRPIVPTPYQSFTPPWRIEHAEFVTPEDIKRAARIGVIFSVQPLHLPMDTEILLNSHRDFVNIAFPWTDFIDAGVALVMGSDAPTTPCDPIKNLAVACGGMRRALLGIPEAPLALHALSRDVALHSHTVGGSIASMGKLGSATLLPGQPADFVILDGDPLRVAVEELEDIHPLETWIQGRRSSNLPEEVNHARTASS